MDREFKEKLIDALKSGDAQKAALLFTVMLPQPEWEKEILELILKHYLPNLPWSAKLSVAGSLLGGAVGVATGKIFIGSLLGGVLGWGAGKVLDHFEEEGRFARD